ncbi:hypothetical protein AAEH92_16385 [Shewanella xiamenensis]|uniref:hypothetical protein n=1 Tax=Shewanella xiamenensis TaxID=332186 RepID=UPI00313B3C8E
MIEKIKKVSNPLTIIAIFAGLAEISGTVVLPLLEKDSQLIYLWFLMGFPVLLICLFFLTLNFNYKVLYAPSDFKDEDNFLKLFGKPTFEEKIDKISSELDEAEEEPKGNGVQINELKYRELIRKNMTSTHYMAEELVMTKLESEFDSVDKDVMFRPGKFQFLFDGIAKKKSSVYAIEVKYLKDETSLKNIRHSLNKIGKALSELSENEKGSINILLALATDLSGDALDAIKSAVSDLCKQQSFSCEYRLFNLEALERELLGVDGL